MFEIKKLTKQNKKAALKISSKIWNGDDYIPHVYDLWIAESLGIFAGCFYKSALVGFGKVSYLNNGVYWLEGLRKDIDFNLKGVGSAILNFFINKLNSRKSTRQIMFATYFCNYESIKLSKKAGLTSFNRFSWLHYHVNKKQAKKFNCLHFKFFTCFNKKTLNYYAKSLFLKKSNNIVTNDWVSQKYNNNPNKLFNNFTKIYCLDEKNNIAGMAFFKNSKTKDVLWVSFMQAKNMIYYKQLLNFLQYQAYKNKKNYIEIIKPKGYLFSKIFTSLKFKSWQRKNDFILFEYKKNN